MKLADFLRADHTVVPLQAATVADAAEVLLERLAASGAVSDVARLRSRVEEERPEDTVAMGDRAFLLHYRTDVASTLVVALGVSQQPICRGVDGGERQCARVVLLIVAPPRLAAQYLQVVGAFARLLSRTEVIQGVLAQPDSLSLVEFLPFMEATLPEQLTVRDVMIPHPVSVAPDTALRDAARRLIRLGHAALPVLDGDGHLLGLLSERELMRHLLMNYLQGTGSARVTGEFGVPQRLVRDVMTRQVLCVSPDQPLADVASLMVNKDVERVPVVHEGRLVGFLTRGDIARKLLGT